ncbi:PEP-utilising enzyme, mobile domain [Andreprevotia lacus DSM 23236]|jgi:pimeloyl-ACP methyl ester carboxylesterase/phosphohistidine swiveling domain-containing protein|uniref:PEP-utilising enzyme, mobile domain n=1 Tax=Andreprevotia lacus DSM 23236 TaxID=1121001 RepID=A0A1W1XUD8_9NEIS|nr:PEP-utilizing enzyme [Andreprevotia lacus]SMC27506.1 PEP-utilising enzyme, mobile domain [Andreprevotia lacus DSM 23236]
MMQTTLYLLGGNGSCARWWQDALPHFQQYQAQAVELPGFGDNPAPPCQSLAELADALLAQTQAGSAIYAVGANALVVLHATVKAPHHFSRIVLQSPVGAFLWTRRLPRLMRWQPLRRLAHRVLAHQPQWRAHQFSRQSWPAERYRLIADGYRHCRAFLPYWDIVQPESALQLFDRITRPIELVWGGADGVIAWQQAAAWEAILCRADLAITLQPDWGHYPWLDDAAGFAAWLEQRGAQQASFPAHGKAGRLQLAELAGLPVPARMTARQADDPAIALLLAQHPHALWAVRSSGAHEDQADCANAGLTRSLLRVAAADVPGVVQSLLDDGIGEVVVQRFVEPVVSGIAFARHLAVEVEWVSGHLSALADGVATPQRAVRSRLGGDWNQGELAPGHGLSGQRLWDFLQQVVRTFHYAQLDIEWAWDGRQLHLLQARPVTVYPWRRQLTAANIGEILPPQPSRLIERAQRHAAASIPAIWARWDSRVLADNEPFTAVHGDASYINSDLFLARLADWGLPSSGYAGEIGGAAPSLPLRPWRVLHNGPRLLRMLWRSRAALQELPAGLQRFDAELQVLQASGADGQLLADWLCRFYLFTVQGNLCIAAAIATSGGAALGQPATCYRAPESAPHRLPFESDPATPRPAVAPLPLTAIPSAQGALGLAFRCGLPGVRGYCIAVREWYRDNLMRIFHRLHQAMPAAERPHWFAPHPAARSRNDSFWQDGSGGQGQQHGFVIVPGLVEGRVGREILIVDTLDPGQHAQYRAASAVIARSGGKLSHGATLLRELGRPSAVMPQTAAFQAGELVRFHDGALHTIDTATVTAG